MAASSFNFNSGRTSQEENFLYKDFVPERISKGGIFKTAKYESFSDLIGKANTWLVENLDWEVRTCECVEFTDCKEDINREKMQYMLYGNEDIYGNKHNTNYQIRCLRLWLFRRCGCSELQQLGYRIFSPEPLEGQSNKYRYEPLSLYLEKTVNKELRQQPLQGKILNIHTQFCNSSRDVELCQWIYYGSGNSKMVIWIFYELGRSESETIGFADFKPVDWRLINISELIEQSNKWVAQQCDVRVTNLQVLKVKVKNEVVDTERTHYRRTYDGVFSTLILRVAYVCSMSNSPTPSISFSHRFFIPVCLYKSSALCIGVYETMTETFKRVNNWLNSAEVKPLNFQTAVVTIDKESTISFLSISLKQALNPQKLYLVWLFFTEEYQEPSPHDLIAVPDPQPVPCCTVI